MKKRILSIDILRGLGIMTIIIIHRLHYHWTGLQHRNAVHEHFSSMWAPLIIAVIVLFTMAGIFYFISGIVNTYSFYHRIKRNPDQIRKTVAGGVAGGLWLLILNYVYRLFFSNGFNPDLSGAEPEFPAGFIIGFIRDSTNVQFFWSQITKPGTLAVIGLILVIVSLALGILLKADGLKHRKRGVRILILLGFIFLLITPLVKFYLRPAYDSAYEMQYYNTALGLGYLCQEFSLSPYLGYGFLGAAIGLSLAMGEQIKVFVRRNLLIMAVLFALGIAAVFIFDREKVFGKWLVESGITYVELGIFLLLLILLLKRVDFRQTTKKKESNRFVVIRGFGMIALTVYFFEPLVAELLMKLTELVVGNLEWTNQFVWVLLFSIFCLFIWTIILHFWKKINFIGSLEWLSVKLMFMSTKKLSNKADFQSIK